MNCSLMFSGIWILAGADTKVPDFVSLLNVIHSYTAEDPLRDVLIASSDLDFSRTATTSPAFRLYDGMFTTPPFTVMCL